MTGFIDPQRIKHAKKLAERDAVEVAKAKYPDLRKEGNDYRAGRRGSFWLSGDGARYYDHETDEGGDIIALNRYCLGLTFAEFMQRYSNGEILSFRPHADRGAIELKESVERFERLNQAAWARARKGTQAVMKYDDLILDGAESLHHHPESLRYFCETRRISPEIVKKIPRSQGCYDPAKRQINFAIRNCHSGGIQGIHQTTIDAAGKKVPGVPKRIFGNAKYGVIVPFVNSSVRSSFEMNKADQKPSFERVGICEGVEDALSYWQMTGTPCMTALNAGNLATLPMVTFIDVKHWVICADHGEAGEKAAEKVLSRWMKHEKTFSLEFPADPYSDFNEQLQREAVQ